MITIILTFLTYGLGYQVEQSDFYQINSFYLPFFLIYLFVFHCFKDRIGIGTNLFSKWWGVQSQILFFVILGIFLRSILLFSIPNLSDDIYRFIWDGRLILNGINPFDHLPKYYIDNNIELEGISTELFNQINSPEYFTIYPPVAQFTFAFSCWLFPTSVLGSSIVMKLFLLCFEIGTLIIIIKLLKRFDLPQRNVLLYALNPLIIIEITGNLHFEGAMIFFFLLGVWLLVKVESKLSALTFFLSAVAMSFSIASKLLPLIFLPFLIKRMGWKKSIQYFSIVGVTLILLFLPLVSNTFLNNFGTSLNLYFQKFEFNASLYYLLRWIGFQVIGFNLIQVLGPVLAIITFSGVLWLSVFEKESSWQNIFQRCLFAICLYLFCTTTVHPWYVSLPVVLCIFTNFRFPILWSGLIMLTYINYSYPSYFENLWIVILEYFAVIGYLIYEISKNVKHSMIPVMVKTETPD